MGTAEKLRTAGYKSLGEVAERYDVNPQTVRNWAETKPKLFHDILLVKAFETSLNHLQAVKAMAEGTAAS